MFINVPESKAEVLAEADVVVCGGGCSGVAAAVAAARQGAKALLLERWPSVGGMATNALVNIWHRSDREKVVINGLVEESIQRADREGWVERYADFPRSHETHVFDPEGMRIVWSGMLKEAGVRTLCYAVAGEPIVEDGSIKAVLVDTKRGRKAIAGRVFVDATGDGDIAAKAGAKFSYGRGEDGLVQGMTLIFELEGIDSSKESERRKMADAFLERMKALRDAGKFPKFNAGNLRHYLSCAADGTLWNMLPVAGNPLDEEELTGLTVQSREMLADYLRLWRKELPGYVKAGIRQTGFAMGVRESRRIKGLKTLDKDMVLGAVKQPDALGHGVWMIDIHDPKGSGTTTHTAQAPSTLLKAGTSYHIPYGMCLVPGIKNLAVAGRCASSTHEAHSSVRVQTHCMVMGEGVGIASAMALDSGVELAKVDVRLLQRTLRSNGVYLEDVPEA